MRAGKRWRNCAHRHAQIVEAIQPVDIDDKTRSKESCPRDGETLGAALGESGGTSHVHRMYLPLGRRMREVLPRAVSFVSTPQRSALGGKFVLREEMGALVWHCLLQFFFDDEA